MFIYDTEMIPKVKEKYFLYLHLQYSKTGVHTGNSTRKYCASPLISHCHSMQGAVEEGHGFSHLGCTCVLSVKYVCAGVEDTRKGESKTDVKAEIIFMYLLSIYFKHSLLN